MKALVIAPNEDRQVTDIFRAELKSLQDLVGGYIQAVQILDGGVMLVDEDGLMKRLPLNPVASRIAGTQIVGTAVVVGSDGSDYTDAPQDYLNLAG